MTDRELLELAADAIGLPPLKYIGTFVGYWDTTREGKGIGCNVPWNPLTYDGDALRLAVKLRINVVHFPVEVAAMLPDAGKSWAEDYGDDLFAATRRAIVRAAAAIGGPHA